MTATRLRATEPSAGSLGVGQLFTPAAFAAAHRLPPGIAAAVASYRTGIRHVLDATVDALDTLAEAVRARRGVGHG